MSKGWVKIRRSLLDWEWYDDHNATRLLLHLIITANYQEKKWKGVVLNPGSRVISWDKLASEIGLSKQQVRTSMRKLEITGEVTRKPTGLFQVVSLVKWEKMQIEEFDPNRELTPKRTEDQQKNNMEVTPTKEREEYKEIKNRKEVFKKQVFELPQDQETKMEFFEYWSEHNDNGKKMRFEMSKNQPFNLNRRMGTWLKRQNQFAKEKSSAKKEKFDAADYIRQKNGISSIR